ncbi:hypothetical protein GCM10029978_089920 [Actinoallomurus acanthiterrae]
MDVNWRKSTRSSGNGGACVEVATWRKSARSGGNGGNCVEVARATVRRAVGRRS